MYLFEKEKKEKEKKVAFNLPCIINYSVTFILTISDFGLSASIREHEMSLPN